MIVINLCGGPCAGKSTVMAGVFAKMKEMGLNVEMASEYVKDCVYSGDMYAFHDQVFTFAQQLKKLRQYNGKVDFVVTDAPLIMNHVYGRGEAKEFYDFVDEETKKYNNIYIILHRGRIKFNKMGRYHGEDRANDIQMQVEALAHKNMSSVQHDVLEVFTDLHPVPIIVKYAIDVSKEG